MLSRPLYRTRQFFGSLRPRVQADGYEAARSLLGRGLTPLFDSMSPRDRAHCLDVYRKLVENGCDEEEVLIAALLHDSGKGEMSGGRVRLWHRVAYVLLAAALPSLLDRVARRSRGLSVLHHHAETGARLAQAMGASERVVLMIREHERRDHADPHQDMLRRADDES